MINIELKPDEDVTITPMGMDQAIAINDEQPLPAQEEQKESIYEREYRLKGRAATYAEKIQQKYASVKSSAFIRSIGESTAAAKLKSLGGIVGRAMDRIDRKIDSYPKVTAVRDSALEKTSVVSSKLETGLMSLFARAGLVEKNKAEEKVEAADPQTVQ